MRNFATETTNNISIKTRYTQSKNLQETGKERDVKPCFDIAMLQEVKNRVYFKACRLFIRVENNGLDALETNIK